MSKTIKAVDIVTEETVEEKPIEETVVEPEPIIEQAKEEEQEPEKRKKNTIEVEEIIDIIKDEPERPSETVKTKEKKTVTCPKCFKVLLEKNYKYSHQSVCGKAKLKSVSEEATQEPKDKPVAVEELPPPPPVKPTYLELRREYNNHLKERKQQLVKRLVSKAF